MLPQLTVYAKIIYLLMVVISGALCTVEDYVIMSQCAHNKAIHVAAEGTVSVTDISQTQNITIVGLPDYVNNNLKIALYAKETQRYLCFNDQWKLVGMKELRDTCYFNETIVHGYFVFRSVVDLQRRVGFTHRGKAVGPKKNVNDACYLFTKIQADQFFHQHTDYFAPKAKSTKIISGIRTSPQTTATTTYTTSGASARLSSQRAALSAAATTATATATAVVQRNHNNKLLRNNNNKNKRVNGGRGSNNNNNNNRKSNNNQNEEYTNGHSSNLSSSNSNNNNHSNSNLVSNSQEQVGLSQQKHHNNNGNSNSRTREHVRQQQQHLVRHHHNDPNLIARRQQHEHKQKRRQNQRQQQRLRTGKITSPTTTTETAKSTKWLASTTATQATFAATAPNATLSSSLKPGKVVQHKPEPATVANFASSAATATTVVMKATTIANKRKGRRRKGRKQRKQQQLAQLQKLEQEMLPLTAQQRTQTAGSPTQTPVERLWSDSPAASSSLTQASVEITSSISSATTYGDYSGEWLSSIAAFTETTAELSSTSTLSSTASVDPAQASTADSNDTSLLLTPTSDYSNNTDFTSEAFADEETSNATLTNELDNNENLPDPTSVADPQLNSITSEQHTTTQDGRVSVTDDESIAPTSTSWSESSVYSWPTNSVATRATTANENNVEAMFPTPTATMETESVAATIIFPEDVNATVETQTSVDDNELFATINTTSSEPDMVDGSSRSDDFTRTLVNAENTLSTAAADRGSDNFTGEPNSISHMWKAQSGIAASIATLLHNQLMSTSASNDEYAWRPRREEEYSDEIVVVTERTTAPEADTSTEVSIGDRATWWQQHMNHSGKNFWDKGIADEMTGNFSADYGWFKQNNKHRNASRRRHSSRNASSNNDKDVETVSHQPSQALYPSESSLGYNKKFTGEGKLQRPGYKAYTNNKFQVSAVAQEYSSTMPTTSRLINARHRQNAINSTTATATSYKTSATTTTTGQPYPLLQLLGNKTISPNPDQPQLLQFDGNSNHLAHTHTPTATTLITHSTTSARPTSTTISNDMTTSTSTAAATATTRKSLRISMQKLLATPFHQLTYVRNNAGDIDIDNIDNISAYPDIFDESVELAELHSTERTATDVSGNSRLTVVSGYMPTSATVKLPESIRLAKVKINKERKRMMSLRKRHSRRYA